MKKGFIRKIGNCPEKRYNADLTQDEFTEKGERSIALENILILAKAPNCSPRDFFPKQVL